MSYDIIHINVNGIRSHAEEKKAALSQAKLISIQDTRLPPGNNFLREAFPNFYIYEIKHNNTTGIALLVHKSVKHNIIRKIENDNKHSLITVLIKDKKLCSKEFYFSSFHAPPASNPHPFNIDLLKLSLSATNAVVVGDFNARHVALGCKGTNKHGHCLTNYLNSTTHVILNNANISTFFHYAHDYHDAIDFAICTNNMLPTILSCHTLHDVGSDHIPLIINLKNKLNKAVSLETEEHCYNHKLTDWKTYTDTLDKSLGKQMSQLTKIRTSNDIDNNTKLTMKLMQEAIEKATPKRRIEDDARPRLPAHILLLIRSRRHLRRQFQTTNNSGLRSKINYLNKLIKKEITTFKKEQYIKRTAPLKRGPSDPRFWPTIQGLLCNVRQELTPIQIEREIYTTPEDKAGIFASHFKRTLTESYNEDFDERFFREIQNELPDLNHLLTPEEMPNVDEQCMPLLKAITADELHNIIYKLKNNSAPGPDGIRYEHIKKAPGKLNTVLLTMFNAMLRTAYIPTCLKRSYLTVIPKVGKNLSEVTSYRPLTLSSSILKVFERIINNRMLAFTLKNNLLKKEQTAFLPGRNSSENITYATQTIINNFNQNKYTLLISLDLKQAFDKVWFGGLLSILLKRFPLHLCRLINSFLTDRHITTRFANRLAQSSFIAKNGLPQGSPISPLLFNLYLAVSPINQQACNYADDTFFIGQGSNPQTAWDNIKSTTSKFIDWCKKYRLEVQHNKTRATFFTRRRFIRKTEYPTMKLNDFSINRDTDVTILGVTIDMHMTLQKHADKIVADAPYLINEIRKIMNRNRDIPSYVAVLLYKALIRPKFTYAVPVLHLLKPTNWQKLKVIEHKALRAAYRTGIRTPLKKLYLRSKLTPISEHYSDLARRYFQSIVQKKNVRLLNTLTVTTPINTKTFTTTPLHLTFQTFDEQNVQTLKRQINDAIT